MRLIWSHCRDINVNVLEKTIRYSIPIYSEDGLIGKLLKANIDYGRLNLIFERKDPPKPQEVKRVLIEENED
jgi:hypothetical protein